MALTRPETTRRGRKRDSHPRGLGSGGTVTVKHARATAGQRAVIGGCLAEAHDLGASRRVMVAIVMCITQESGAGALMTLTGNDDVGIFQQGRNWISAADAKRPGPSTKAFLVTGPTSWKKRHGSLKNAPGNLPQAIHLVQGNARASDYAPWETEASATVATWLGADGDGFGDSSSGGRSYTKRYEFTRGERNGARETSWDAMSRLGDEVGFRRWAATNVLFFASEDELRAGAPAVELRGDEAWLLGRPQWEWGSGRAVSEITLRVLADRWGVLPGAVVMLSTPGPTKGRWLVKSVSGQRLDSPEVDVVLKRPTRHRPEPASDTATTGDSGGGDGSIKAACSAISAKNYPYVWGGGHARVGTPDGGTGRDPGIGYDCSGSVAAAIADVGGMGIKAGAPGNGSGWFASSWGRPGKGRDFTVWANATHVWIEGYDQSGFAWRFDTSPHGSGPSGPHVRETARNDQARFTARHWS